MDPTERPDHSQAPRSDTVAERMRTEILTGTLPPGMSLREVAIAERFEVSRNTVREAMRVLVTEGLVRHTRHRGAEVMSHTVEDVNDIYRARTLLEVAAIERVTGRTDIVLTALTDALDRLQVAVDNGDWHAGTDADLAFHHGIVDLAGSSRLSAFHASLQNELRMLLLLAERDIPEPDKVGTHRHLYDLLLAGDLSALRESLIGHVTGGEANLRAMVARREASLASS